MKRKLLCLLLALVMLLSVFVACSEEEPTGDNSGDENGGTQPVDASTTENYLPSDLFEQVKTAFAKKDASSFPALNYNEAPFAISDAAVWFW